MFDWRRRKNQTAYDNFQRKLAFDNVKYRMKKDAERLEKHIQKNGGVGPVPTEWQPQRGPHNRQHRVQAASNRPMIASEDYQSTTLAHLMLDLDMSSKHSKMEYVHATMKKHARAAAYLEINASAEEEELDVTVEEEETGLVAEEEKVNAFDEEDEQFEEATTRSWD
ncbi:hypothetical protein BT63DRAFT_420994, partial [Microthyrium microscopicum]